MSRGHGTIQCTLLSVLEARAQSAELHERMVDTYDLSAIVYGLDRPEGRVIVTPQQLKAVRRALKALVSEDRVVGLRGWHDHRARWCTPEAYAAYMDWVRATFRTEPGQKLVAGRPEAR